MSTLKVKVLSPKATMPTRAYIGDSGIDLAADDLYFIKPGETGLIGTGIAFELPEGCEGQVRPRSSIAKRGILVHFGTIDEGYRGEVGVRVTNLSVYDFIVQRGDRIAQFVVSPILRPEIEEVKELSITERNEKGYGSSGK